MSTTRSTTAISGPRDSAVLVYHASGARPLLRGVSSTLPGVGTSSSKTFLRLPAPVAELVRT